MAKALGNLVPTSVPDNSPFARLYVNNGMTLRFTSAEQSSLTCLLSIKDLFTTIPAKSFVAAFESQLQFPLDVQLNVAYSVDTPTEAHRPGFEAGLAMQITGAAMNLTRCVNSPTVWHPEELKAGDKCLFSRYCNTCDIAALTSTNTVAKKWVEGAVTAMDLDTVALFPQPFQICFPLKKETRQVQVDGQPKDEQRWFELQSCMNCLAAGMYVLCTYHVSGRAWMINDTPSHVDVVDRGARGDYDAKYGDAFYEILHHMIGRTSLAALTNE